MTYPMTYLYLGCFALQAVLAAVVWLATPGQPVRWPVVAIMVFGAFWALADLLANLAESAEQMRLFLHIFVFSWVLIPYLLLRAALAYTGHRRVLWSVPWNAVLLLPAAGIAYLTWSNRLFVDFVPAGIQAPYFHSVRSGTAAQMNTAAAFATVSFS